MAEFLIDTGMELARNIIFFTMKTFGEETGKHMGHASNAERVRTLLQPQLDKLEEEIKDIAESTYKTSLSHLHHALVIFGSTFDEIEGGKVSKTIYDRLKLETEQGVRLPKSALRLIDEAYDKAYNAFNYSTNLSVEKRAIAMQVALLCIGIQHIDQPRLVMHRWEKCMRDIFRDSAFAKCIDKHVSGSKFQKFIHGHKKGDFNQITILARDVLLQITRFGAREDVSRDLVAGILERIIHPEELPEDVRPLWSLRLEWQKATQHIQYRGEIKLRSSSGSPFDACCVLPDGVLVVAKGNDEIVRYSSDLERLLGVRGSYYDICYDSVRNILWAYNNHSNTLIPLSPQSLEVDGSPITCPVLINHDGSEIHIARWHIAVALNGTIAIAAQLQRAAQIRSNDPHVFVRSSLESDWISIPTSGKMIRSRITSLAAGVASSGEGTKLAVALENKLYRIDFANVSDVDNAKIRPILQDQFVDQMACTIDEQGRLIAVVRQQIIGILDSEWQQLVSSCRCPRANGNWIVASARRIYTSNLLSDIEQYEYFIVYRECL